MIRRFARWVYRALLRTLPRPFREAYSKDMEDLFLEMLEAPARRGAVAHGGAWIRGMMDVVDQAVRLRSTTARHGRGSRQRRNAMESMLQDLRFAVRSLVKGGLGGVALAALTLRFAESYRPVTAVAVAVDLGLDHRVLLFSALVTLATVVAVGLVPAWRSSRPDLVPALKEGSETTPSRLRWFHLRSLLVVSQVSASLLLLVGAGLFLRSLRSALDVDPGFDVEGLATVTLNLGPERYSPEDAGVFFDRLAGRMAGHPGVTAVSTTDALPMTLTAGQRSGVDIPGYTPADGEDMAFQVFSIGPGFAETLGMEVLAGREFTSADDADGELTVVVNESFAERFWPGESPLGRQVTWGTGNEARVVGLLRDAMYRNLQDRDRPAFFLPLAQNPSVARTLVARTDPEAVEEILDAMRTEIRALDSRLTGISSLRSMHEAIAFTLLPQRLASWLLSLAGGLGLLLAAVGLYGVMAYLVSQRTREVGIRMALGAERGAVVQMVVRRGLVLAAIGTAAGLSLAALLTRFLEVFLFGVNALDVTVFGVMGMAALLVAAAASYFPARRAAGVDPAVTLREE